METLTAVAICTIALGTIFLLVALLMRQRQLSRDHAAARAPSSEQPAIRRSPPPIPMVGQQRVTFFDVETTGLSAEDRIVTIAAIKLLNPEISGTELNAEFLHLVFDPERRSHPKAEDVHGYSDWVLRHQETFDVYAETIQTFFNSSDVVVAHNAEFDLAFYNREMERSGRAPFAGATFCTMTAFRQLGLPGSASLNAACQTIGIARANRLHGALEDAWLALRVYLWLKKVSFSAPLPPEFQASPSNLKPVPPPPDGPLPRRRRNKQPTRAE